MRKETKEKKPIKQVVASDEDEDDEEESDIEESYEEVSESEGDNIEENVDDSEESINSDEFGESLEEEQGVKRLEESEDESRSNNSSQKSDSSDSEAVDLENVEAEYSEEEGEEEKELFPLNVNSSNYFERILKGNKQSLKDLEGIKYDPEFLKKRLLSKVNLEKEELYKNDEGEFQKLIDDLSKNLKEEESKLLPLSRLTRSRGLKLDTGISFLNSKNEIFANYLICLHFYLLYKLNGVSLKDSPVLKKLIFYKTLLMKLKPVEKKMDYQISKLMKLSLKAQEKTEDIKKGITNSDPIAFRPHPELIEDDEEEHPLQEDISENVSNISEDEELKPKKQQQQKPTKYVPPMLTAVFKEEDKIKQRMKQEESRRKQYLVRQLSKNLESDINTFKNDRPIVERFSETDKLAKKEKEIQEYEEKHFVRLPSTKQDKKRIKQIEKNKNKLERIDNMQELKDIRELLHYEKLAHDPEVEQKDKERLQKTLQKYKNNNKQKGQKGQKGQREQKGGQNKFNKDSNPTKKIKTY